MVNTELEREKSAASAWGTIAAISWLALVGSVGVEGAIDVFTAGLGLALAPEELAVDSILGVVALYSTRKWHEHHSRYTHLRRGGQLEDHKHTHVIKNIKYRRPAGH